MAVDFNTGCVFHAGKACAEYVAGLILILLPLMSEYLPLLVEIDAP